MNTNKKISKRLSFWLRHQPEDAGLTLTPDGWTNVDQLLNALSQTGVDCRRDQLESVVATNDKKRFEFSSDGAMIRARQGHSVEIDLGLDIKTPPGLLYHGTATRFLPSILKEGLKPMKRHHVHLSADISTAINVGSRHGKPVVLTISACTMYQNGHEFYQTANDVWLTACVSPKFLTTENE
jgi:putative RNA 2'-phosphotransferase